MAVTDDHTALAALLDIAVQICDNTNQSGLADQVRGIQADLAAAYDPDAPIPQE